MSGKRSRWPWILGGFVVLLVVAVVALTGTAAPPTGEYTIDLVALHRVALDDGAPLPDHIEVERVATFAFPRTLVVAGDGFRMHQMVLLAHRVVWPDHHSAMIDTAMGPEGAKKMPGSHMTDGGFDRVEAAMKQASAIVFTHEHVDHVGGVAAAPDVGAITRQTMFTKEQLESPRLERGDFPAGALDKMAPLSYSGMYLVAPGIVLQHAPGHSPGSQLVYVELADGKRFLFVGDIAWTRDNVTLQKGRPAIATLLMKEDRGAVAAQLRALAKLPADVHLVIAHDPVALAEDLRAGLYRDGFQAP
ncbi:MAG TPA: MBL fold metallo-hydrolase [Polyangia bacterium]|nr:MBL fold metallo-hydrolase [Polyangia bacterium]